MEIRIGIAQSPRELSFEIDGTPQDIEKLYTDALENEARTVTFTDERGRRYIVPVASISFIETGPEEAVRIGFVG